MLARPNAPEFSIHCRGWFGEGSQLRAATLADYVFRIAVIDLVEYERITGFALGDEETNHDVRALADLYIQEDGEFPPFHGGLTIYA